MLFTILDQYLGVHHHRILLSLPLSHLHRLHHLAVHLLFEAEGLVEVADDLENLVDLDQQVDCLLLGVLVLELLLNQLVLESGGVLVEGAFSSAFSVSPRPC